MSARVAIVAGAASGIGRAIAEHLAAQEVQVVVADLNEQVGQSTSRGPLTRQRRSSGTASDAKRSHGPAGHHQGMKTGPGGTATSSDGPIFTGRINGRDLGRRGAARR